MNIRLSYRKIIKVFVLTFVFSLSLQSLCAEGESETNKEDKILFTGNAQSAMSSKDYIVTAGDTYSLSFYSNGTSVSYTITVDPTYKIRVVNLGIINCSGLTFIQLKQDIEKLVMKNYPLSVVSFVMLQPSSFKVVVSGEVATVRELRAWSLNRLSDMISAAGLTEFASTRNIKVKSSNGKVKTCDLFKANRQGDFSQDPYLRPGDTIEFSRFERKVSISGAVERPGTYELLKGENLSDLVKFYGNGLLVTADPARIQLLRMQLTGDKLTKISLLSEKAISDNFELKDSDSIYIPTTAAYRPYIEITGIIGNGETDVNDPERYSIRRRKIYFYQDENYSTLIRRISEYFTVFSDLKKTYITRNGQQILIEADRIMDDPSFVSQYFVEKGDEIIVPYRPLFKDTDPGMDYSFE